MSGTNEYWQTVRAHFDAEASAAEQAAEPKLTAEDVPLSEWGAARSALNIHDSGELVGIGTWRYPQQPEQVEFSAMDEYTTERAAAGIPEAPQASCGDTRVNPSAYRIT